MARKLRGAAHDERCLYAFHKGQEDAAEGKPQPWFASEFPRYIKGNLDYRMKYLSGYHGWATEEEMQILYGGEEAWMASKDKWLAERGI